MKKKVLSIILTLLLAFTGIVPAMAAEPAGAAADSSGAAPADTAGFSAEPVNVSPDDLAGATAIINGALEDLDDLFDSDQAAEFGGIFDDFVNACSTAGTIISPINGSITFLKLIGVIKDKTTDNINSIMAQLSDISDLMESMDNKLNRITEQMARIKADEDFNNRTSKAIILQSAWHDFESRYMEVGIEALITKFNGKVLDGMQEWCMATDSLGRRIGNVDNSQLVLLYNKENENYTLQYTTKNGIPADVAADARYLVLDADLLPGTLDWNVNTYRQNIKTAIINKIKARISTGGTFTAQNFPGFDGTGTLTDAMIEAAAEDAINVLTYRISSAQLNRNSELALEVQSAFTYFCSHLLAANEGLDAVYKSMYLTHSFEGEIKDDFIAFCNQMIVRAGVYGAFAMNILGMSDFITDAQWKSALGSYCKTINTIGECMQNGLTGKDNYCYLTNCCLYLGDITFTNSGVVRTYTSGTSLTGYDSYSAQPTQVEVSYMKNRYASANELIGDSDIILLQYMLASNGNTFGFDYLNKMIGYSTLRDYRTIVVDLDGEQTLPLNSSFALDPTNLIGSYFAGKSSVSLANLPGRADTDYVNYRRMETGTVVDTKTGAMTAGKILSAFAIYGENHWYWSTDEAAFLGGPYDEPGFTSSCNTERTGVSFPDRVNYSHNYTQKVIYNTIICKPTEILASGGDGASPIVSYINLCDEMKADAAAKAAADKAKEQLKQRTRLVVRVLAPILAIKIHRDLAPARFLLGAAIILRHL